MVNYNSFNFSIKIEQQTEELEDLSLIMDKARGTYNYYTQTIDRVYEKSAITAANKFEIICEQVKPLMEAYEEFVKFHKEAYYPTGIQTFIARPNPLYEGSYDFYKVLLQRGRKPLDYILYIDVNSSSQTGKPAVEVNYAVAHEKLAKALLDTENPFSCWEDWGVFEKLKDELIFMISKNIEKQQEVAKNFRDFERNLGKNN